MQVGTANGARVTVSKTIHQVMQERGIAGFYQGFRYGVLRAVPMSALSFGTYELVRAWLAMQPSSISNAAVQSDINPDNRKRLDLA